MSSKSLGRLVWKSRNCAHGSSLRVVSQRSAFSSSATFQKSTVVPSFTETASDELNNILSEFRSKILLPACLSKEHKLLIFNRKHQAALQDEPVMVHIGDEAFRLSYINKNERPGFHKTLWKAVKLFSTKEDWKNLIPLLTGFKMAGHKTSTKAWFHFKRRLIQKAGNVHRLDVLIDCARQVDSTDFTLDSPIIVMNMVWFTQKHAALQKWDPAFTEKQLSRVEEIVYLLEDERHAGGYNIRKFDPRTRPELIGILLQMSAVLAVKKHGGEDVGGKVKKYAERLRAVIEQGEDFYGLEERQEYGFVDGWGDDNIFLYQASPVIHGLRVAQEVLEQGSALWYWTKAQETLLGEAADAAYERLSGRVQRFHTVKDLRKAEKEQNDGVLLLEIHGSEGEKSEGEEAEEDGSKARPKGLETYELLFEKSTS